MVRVLDSQLSGCEFDSRPPRCRVTTSCKLFTPICLWRSQWSSVSIVACSRVHHDSHRDSTAFHMGSTPIVPRLTQPFTLHGMVKRVSVFALSINNKWRWWMWMLAAIYWRPQSPSRLAWSEGWRPPSAQSAVIKWTGWTLALTMVMRTAP